MFMKPTIYAYGSNVLLAQSTQNSQIHYKSIGQAVLKYLIPKKEYRKKVERKSN